MTRDRDRVSAAGRTSAAVERKVTLRAVTLIMAAVVGLTFLFGFGNVWTLALRLGVPPWVAPLVAPAVDLSVMGLLPRPRRGRAHLGIDGGTRVASVVGLSARYANFLIHPLPPGPGVCQTCHGTAKPGYPTCWPCQQAAHVLGNGVADAVVPISLALKREQYANELRRYKNTHGSQQQYFRMGLAAVLWRFLAAHEPCIATHCAVPRFDTVTIVPSTSGREGHPLHAMVADMVDPTRDRYRDLLTPAEHAQALGRTASLARYTSSALWGEAVLLVDDTWTTGAHAQSAAAALKAAGAGCVAVVVLGRHLNSEYGDTAVHVEHARLRRFSWDVCSLRNWQHG